jgi:hypothetical protein
LGVEVAGLEPTNAQLAKGAVRGAGRLASGDARGALAEVAGGLAAPIGDGRDHGMVPIVCTQKGAIVSGAPQANAAIPVGVLGNAVRGLRSADGGKTWKALHPFPHFGVVGYHLTALGNGWVVLTSIVYGVGKDGEWAC